MEHRNVSVRIFTVNGYQYVLCKIGGRQLYLGPIELVGELVDELNARGINKAKISFMSEDIKRAAELVRELAERLNKLIEELNNKAKTSKDIKLAEKAKEMTAAEAEAKSISMERRGKRKKRKRKSQSPPIKIYVLHNRERNRKYVYCDIDGKRRYCGSLEQWLETAMELITKADQGE